MCHLGKKSLTEELIFFVHIPKTAGSSINHYLKKNLGKGYVHCEHFFLDEKKLRKNIQKSNWMSGHVTYNSARIKLEKMGVEKPRFFSCVRKPDAQVMSHLNWLLAIRHKSLIFFKRHPKLVQDISNDIYLCGLDSKQQVLQVLQKYQWLFLNTQWNTILAPETEIDKVLVEQRLDCFEYIGTDTNISDLLMAMTGKHIKQPKIANKSKYYFDTRIFQDDEIRDFLSSHNQKDLYLYHRVKAKFQSSPIDVDSFISHDPPEELGQ